MTITVSNSNNLSKNPQGIREIFSRVYNIEKKMYSCPFAISKLNWRTRD